MGEVYELPSGNVGENDIIKEGVRETKEKNALDVKNIGMFVNTFDYLSESSKKVDNLVWNYMLLILLIFFYWAW